jgi:hypothetical protein
MNFAKVGQKVKHKAHGSGKVTKVHSDEGVTVKLDSGKNHRIKYTDDGEGSKGWSKMKESEQQNMAPEDLVEMLLAEAPGTGAGLKLRSLGFAPLDAQDRMAFQGAGQSAVILNLDQYTLIYDLSSRQFEVITADADSVFSDSMNADQAVALATQIVANPTEQGIQAATAQFEPAPEGTYAHDQQRQAAYQDAQ